MALGLIPKVLVVLSLILLIQPSYNLAYPKGIDEMYVPQRANVKGPHQAKAESKVAILSLDKWMSVLFQTLLWRHS